jgi:dUTP pyrophosphatase
MSFVGANQTNLSILRGIHPTFMHLRLYIDANDNELVDRYVTLISSHNNKILDPTYHHLDAGFDLFVPKELTCLSSQVNKIDLEVKCSAQIVSNNSEPRNTGFYMYPRSSISNTPLRLANSVGIIDSGYRGRLMGKFDCMQNQFLVNKCDRLLQVCAPGLIPIYVELANNQEMLGSTERGDGGFGSTGR